MKPDYEKKYLNVWKVDEREIELHERLKQYYSDDGMDNKTALIEWRSFKDWTLLHGYSSEEVNRAKRNMRF